MKYGFQGACAQCALGTNQSKPVLGEESSLRLINFLPRASGRVFAWKWFFARRCLPTFVIYSSAMSTLLWTGLLFVSLGGCANEKAHDNFKTALNYFVGRDISEARNFFRIDKTEIKKLPNGNIEYRFTGRENSSHGLCTKLFEVEPASQKVLSAHFVGSKRDCVVPL